MTNFPHYGPSVVALMDIPLVRGDEEMPWAPRVCAFQSPWPGAVSFTRLEDDQHLPFDFIKTAGKIGHITTDLQAGPVWIIDRSTKLTIEIYGHHQILSINDEQFLRGGNLICVEGTTGWELLQFKTAKLIGPNQYELSHLLRGQHGTEHFMGAKAGARLVFWDEAACEALDIPQDMSRLPFVLRYGPNEHNPTYHTWTERQVQFRAQGMTPYAPVHLKFTDENGIWKFSWIRRTRVGGDAWEQVDVPIAEERELYDIEIWTSDGLDETIVASGIDIDRPEWETSSQGNGEFVVKVWQKNAFVGRGKSASLRIEK